MTDPRSFYTETVPEQFNRTLEAETHDGVRNEMCAVDTTIVVKVDDESFFLNVDAGRMSPGSAAAHAPFLTLVQDRRTFERISEEAGDSALALLGGLSGLAGEMKLTRTRIQNLAFAKGCIRFEVTGENGFALLTHFGPDPVPDEPDATIRVDDEIYAELRAGRVDPPQAFLDGRIAVEGDVQLTMQLALAALAPD